MKIAKVFQNGRSQAIRLPKEFRVDSEEVYLKRTPEGFLVIPRNPWELFLEGGCALGRFLFEGTPATPVGTSELAEMIYLLDTDMPITMVRGLRQSRRRDGFEKARRLVQRCQKSQKRGHLVGLSAITVAELMFGAHISGDDEELTSVQKVIAPFTLFDWDAIQAPLHYGRLRHGLEKVGKPIGAMDLLIAAHALSLEATLVTNNVAHFGRIPELKIESWP